MDELLSHPRNQCGIIHLKHRCGSPKESSVDFKIISEPCMKYSGAVNIKNMNNLKLTKLNLLAQCKGEILRNFVSTNVLLMNQPL